MWFFLEQAKPVPTIPAKDPSIPDLNGPIMWERERIWEDSSLMDIYPLNRFRFLRAAIDTHVAWRAATAATPGFLRTSVKPPNDVESS